MISKINHHLGNDAVLIVTKTQIIENYWVEFLGYVKKYNLVARRKEIGQRLSPIDKNFWEWYIRNKLDD